MSSTVVWWLVIAARMTRWLGGRVALKMRASRRVDSADDCVGIRAVRVREADER